MGLFNKEKGTVKLVPLEVVPVRQSLDEEDTFVKETVVSDVASLVDLGSMTGRAGGYQCREETIIDQGVWFIEATAS